jgi:hypothetical protein
MGATERESPGEIYDELCQDVYFIIDRCEADQCVNKGAFEEKDFNWETLCVTKQDRDKKARTLGDSHRDKLRDHSHPYKNFLDLLRLSKTLIMGELVIVKGILDQDVFNTLSEQRKKPSSQDYRTVDVQQLKEDFLKGLPQALEALESSIGPEGTVITKTMEKRIREKMRDCLEIITRIHKFSWDGRNAHPEN